SQVGQTVMTPPEFLTHVAWPGVRPTFSGESGAGAAGDDAENAASDAEMEERDASDDDDAASD
ncbi:hypothetical protein A2U01_0062961, partial [Trifolium medium]|nr:hypothetical protein [Trifolium medium]